MLVRYVDGAPGFAPDDPRTYDHENLFSPVKPSALEMMHRETVLLYGNASVVPMRCGSLVVPGRMLAAAQINRARLDTNSWGSAYYKKLADDKDKEQWKSYRANLLGNPEEVARFENKREEEAEVRDPNTLYAKWLSDPGTASFNYDVPDKDNVEQVKRSNYFYERARNKYFEPPAGVDEGKDEEQSEIYKALGRVASAGGSEAERQFRKGFRSLTGRLFSNPTEDDAT